MSDFRLKTQQDITDFLTGCAFYGTGGGGDVKAGRASLGSCLQQGLDMMLTDPQDIDDEAIYCSAFFMGSIAPKTPELLEEMEKNGYGERKYSNDDMLIGAVRKLEEYIGKKVAGLVVAEPGGSNSACCMSAAYKMGLAVLNGDPAGRAIPEMTQGLPAIKGMSCLPAVYFDSWGNSSITTEAFGYSAAERIGKFLSEASYGELAEAAYVMTGKQVREILIPYSLSRAFEVGRAINQAVASQRDVLQAAATACGGAVVGRGVVTNISTQDSGGYYWGSYMIQGDGGFPGNEYKIWFKNENHILWINGVPHTTSPDLITVVNSRTGVPLLNSYLKEGEFVGIVISPSHENYLSSESIKVFGPGVFGFDFDYIPYAGSSKSRQTGEESAVKDL